MADTLRDKFETWARDHLGQGYPLTMDEDVYEHPVTRWAFKAFVAGRASRPGVKLDPAFKAALDEATKTGATSAVLPSGGAVFINRGHDYGDNSHLECTACGGSGHIDDQRAALASRPAEVDDEGLPPLPDPWHGFQFNSGWNSWEQVSHWAVGDPHVTRAYTEEQFRQGQRDAVAVDRARRNKGGA